MALQLSDDLVQYRTVILSLITYAMHPKLDTLIEKLTPKVINSKRFLIKMEIKRLAKPCSLVIDFRPYFDQCEAVPHQNICHYLDKISKTLFLASVEKNNGLFSIHIYNELNSKAKKRHRALLGDQTITAIHSKISIEEIQQLSLVNNLFFNEPQISCKSKCRLFSYDPLGMSYKGKISVGIEVSTLDINQHSFVIKAPINAISNPDEPVFLWLYEHNALLDFDQEIVLEFSVEDHKKPQSGKSSHYLLKLGQTSDSKMITTLAELLAKKLQLSNKTQSKQIQPLVSSINAKCHEQFLLNATQDIPLLCAEYQTGWLPSTALKTLSNHKLWQFFSVHNSYDALTRLFCNMDIQNAINSQEEFDDYAYILKHSYKSNADTTSEEKTQFIIIWQSTLNHDYAARSFLTQHILNNDYRFVRLRIIPINAQQDAHVPSAVPNYINSAMALLNRPLTKQAATLLKASNQLAILSDVTELNDALALSEQLDVKISNVNKEQPLSCPVKFILPKLARKSSMEIVNANISDFRVEDRFDHQLNLTLSHYNNQPIKISGVTVNISTKGLLIKLEQPIKFKAGAIIRLQIDIPYRGKVMTMKNQAYQLLGSHDNNTFRLIINGSEAKHAACQALQEFIYHNLDDLAHSGHEQESIYGLQRAMRNIYANNHLSVPFFIHQDKRQWHISSVAMNQHTKIQHFNEYETSVQAMLLNMVEQEKFRNYCLSLLNKIDLTNPVEVFYILTLPRKSATDEQLGFWFSDIGQLQQSGRLSDVLDKIRSLKKPTVLRVQLSKPSKITDKYFRDELKYLEQISSSSAENLMSNMALMTGIGEITDHTEQILHLFDTYIAKPQLAKAG